jgi:hypothetical protein
MPKKVQSKKKKLSKSHREKISNGLKKYHKSCKRSKSRTDTDVKSFLAGIKTNSNKSKKQLKKK